MTTEKSSELNEIATNEVEAVSGGGVCEVLGATIGGFIPGPAGAALGQFLVDQCGAGSPGPQMGEMNVP